MANDENVAIDIVEGEVHLSVVVGEDTHLRNLLGEPFHFGVVDFRAIGRLNSEKYKETLTDSSCWDTIGYDTGMGDPLYDSFHRDVGAKGVQYNLVNLLLIFVISKKEYHGGHAYEPHFDGG